MTTISGGLDRFANNATTTLNGGINNSQTSIVFTSALGFPNPGPYRILIDNEQMQVTGGYGTVNATVIRAVDGTAAALHSNTAPITNNITAFDYNSFRQEWNPVAYGAVGDGANDDSTAFQNCINDAHAQTGGGHIFLPDLPFKVVSTLTTYSNVSFITYGAVLSGAGASSVTPLIKWSQLGGLTVPGVLTASTGLVITTGGASVTAGGLAVSSGGANITGNTTVAAAQTSGQIGFTLSPSAVGTVTAETIGAQDSAQVLTITSGYTTQRFRVLKASTITAASALTVTNAATMAIEGPPIVGGSAVLTNPWALWIQAGTSRFDGAVDVNAGIQVRGTGLTSGGNAFAITPPAVGTVVAETFVNQTFANTLTITSGYATQRFNLINAPTISAGSALTVTNAATLAITGAPTVGGSAVITNPYALWVQAGTTKLDGAIVHSRNSADTIPVTAGTNPTGVTIYIQSGTPSSPNEGDIWFQG